MYIKNYLTRFSSLPAERSQRKWEVALSWWEEWMKEYIIGNNMLRTRKFCSCGMFSNFRELSFFFRDQGRLEFLLKIRYCTVHIFTHKKLRLKPQPRASQY